MPRGISAKGFPHILQNLLSSVHLSPQCGQVACRGGTFRLSSAAGSGSHCSREGRETTRCMCSSPRSRNSLLLDLLPGRDEDASKTSSVAPLSSSRCGREGRETTRCMCSSSRSRNSLLLDLLPESDDTDRGDLDEYEPLPEYELDRDPEALLLESVSLEILLLSLSL